MTTQFELGLELTSAWTAQQEAFLKENYPTRGKLWCAEQLGKTSHMVRAKAARLGLRLDHNSEFAKEFQRRAAASHVGKKRPEQAILMRELNASGRINHTQESRAKGGATLRVTFATKGHPRGALGMRHTEEAKVRISEASKAAWRSKTEAQREEWGRKHIETRRKNGTVAPYIKRGRWKASWREIGGKRAFFRSRWEANYGRYLEWLRLKGEIRSWEHEPETFWFEGIQRGTVSYLPDFRVTTNSGVVEYHEVKGWMDQKSRTKIMRFRLYYPQFRLVVIEAKSYKEIAKWGRIIPGWEAEKP